eukprot:CAMPEP_0196588190 /NCGR_PEP_ID=MMETSP1081-20130531/59770_1 /TAXON_ID=36882 /ORGANISM="Pyramimonas amylifera, Strain CCMP720" /LENGTH=529 /DNA_ID=CAMNT_0041910615 /DNA_START=272 /DNA_END=1861 /DNA_ORIENTATION=+
MSVRAVSIETFTCVGHQAMKDLAITCTPMDPMSWSGDLLVVGVFEEEVSVSGEGANEKIGLKEGGKLAELDAATAGLVGEMMAEADFKAKVGSSICSRLGGDVKRVALVGMGKAEDITHKSWKSLGAAVARLAKTHKAGKAAVALVGAPADMDTGAAVEAVSVGALLGVVDDTRFKSKSTPPTLGGIEMISFGADNSTSVASAGARAAGTLLTKQLVSAPPNVATPTFLAEAAADIASEFPDVMSLKVLEWDDCEALKMGAYLGVAEASEEPLKFIHLTYTAPGGSNDSTKKLAIVGKGLTFDSGGYNIKAGAGSMIELMKFDMGGSGAVLGAARSLAELQPEGVEVHFIIASCENMVAGKGLRPGDILTASNGKTIEVNNTDAEGRLTLADALIYAENLGVSKTVDIATLTGACMVALGTGVAGLFTPSDSMAEELAASGARVGEKLWRMPMEESYRDQLDSPIADMKNCGMGKGGAITAALFLKEYVREMEWAHLDIAGPVWDDKTGSATGFAAGSLTEWVLANSSK